MYNVRCTKSTAFKRERVNKKNRKYKYKPSQTNVRARRGLRRHALSNAQCIKSRIAIHQNVRRWPLAHNLGSSFAHLIALNSSRHPPPLWVAGVRTEPTYPTNRRNGANTVTLLRVSSWEVPRLKLEKSNEVRGAKGDSNNWREASETRAKSCGGEIMAAGETAHFQVCSSAR